MHISAMFLELMCRRPDERELRGPGHPLPIGGIHRLGCSWQAFACDPIIVAVKSVGIAAGPAGRLVKILGLPPGIEVPTVTVTPKRVVRGWDEG